MNESERMFVKAGGRAVDLFGWGTLALVWACCAVAFVAGIGSWLTGG